jgi:hypothetical protein
MPIPNESGLRSLIASLRDIAEEGCGDIDEDSEYREACRTVAEFLELCIDKAHAEAKASPFAEFVESIEKQAHAPENE